MICFVVGLIMGIMAGCFCMSMMKVSADSEKTVQLLNRRKTR